MPKAMPGNTKLVFVNSKLFEEVYDMMAKKEYLRQRKI